MKAVFSPGWIKVIIVGCLLGLLALSLHIALAQTYPQSQDSYVNDFANVITATDKQALETQLSQFQQQTGVQLVVVTINAVSDYNASTTVATPTIETFAKNLFNAWGVGDKATNNGIMILVAIKNHEARIQLGSGYASQYNGVAQNIVNNDMVPYFKNGEYSTGIVQGVQATMTGMTQKISWLAAYGLELLLGLLVIVLVIIGISLIRSGKKGWGWTVLAAAGVVLLFLIKMFFRSGGKGGGFGGGSSSGGGASGSW